MFLYNLTLNNAPFVYFPRCYLRVLFQLALNVSCGDGLFPPKIHLNTLLHLQNDVGDTYLLKPGVVLKTSTALLICPSPSVLGLGSSASVSWRLQMEE